jgi:nucleoside-diphosphate-sugar epimerase
MNLLVVGCGYLGRRVAELCLSGGGSVTALTRSSSRAAEFRTAGIEPIVGDVLDPASLSQLPASDVLVHAVGYDPTAGVGKREVFVEGLRNVLTTAGARAGRVIIVSSSSVYGQSRGEWVDEDSPTLPQSDGGRICLAAEDVVREYASTSRVCSVILRLSGIYGPGRWLAKAEALRRGEPLAGSGDAWLNLTHVEDAARAVLAAAEHPTPHSLYLVTDDRPVRRSEYYERLAQLHAAPPPTFDSREPPRHGQGLNKRCSNARLMSQLGLVWKYPTFEEGLRSGQEL